MDFDDDFDDDDVLPSHAPRMKRGDLFPQPDAPRVSAITDEKVSAAIDAAAAILAKARATVVAERLPLLREFLAALVPANRLDRRGILHEGRTVFKFSVSTADDEIDRLAAAQSLAPLLTPFDTWIQEVTFNGRQAPSESALLVPLRELGRALNDATPLTRVVGAGLALDRLKTLGIDERRGRELLQAATDEARNTGPDMAPAEREARLAELREVAAPVLASSDPLQLVTNAIRGLGYGGDVGPAIITYLAATSRLLAQRVGSMPVHLLLLGVASAGKSYTWSTVRRLLPSESCHEIDAGSPRVLIYDGADLRHRVVTFGEADSLPAGEDNPAASAVRNLLQEHELRYAVVVKGESGKYETQNIIRPGPTVLITTAVRRLGAQLDSRLFTLEVPEDVKQVRQALATQALIELTGVTAPDPALLDFQRYLQTLVPWGVVVPFVGALNEAIGQALAGPRILRDASKLLALVKSVTVLRHQHRGRDSEGRLVAEVADYQAVYDLVADLYEGSTTGASEGVRQVVEAVVDLRKDRPSPYDDVKVIDVAKRLDLAKVTAWRRVQAAIDAGFLTNLEHRPGRPAKLEPGDPLPPRGGLPEPQSVLAQDHLPVKTETAKPADPGGSPEGPASESESYPPKPLTDRNCTPEASRFRGFAADRGEVSSAQGVGFRETENPGEDREIITIP